MIVSAKGSREKAARKEWNEGIFGSRPLRAGLNLCRPYGAGAAPTNGWLRAESSKSWEFRTGAGRTFFGCGKFAQRTAAGF